jgi:hypothetical protein
MLMIRWEHMQNSDPISVHMYVRAISKENPAFSYVYPYTHWRVQPRFSRQNQISFTRYVRIEQEPNSSDLAITWVRVKIRQVGTGSAAAFFQNLVISHPENVRNPATTLTQSGTGNHSYDDPTSRINLLQQSVIEYDIGPNARVEKVWIYGDSLI